MPQYKVLYTADIHGNEVQYQKLVDYAKRISANAIIIGGDIAPKEFPSEKPEDYIKGQGEFIEHMLPELFQPLKEKLPDSNLFLMMGNDDCAANLDILERNDPNLYQIIHGKRINLTDDFDIVGYSYVPITPFAIKDWEKFDLSHVPPGLEVEYANRKKTNYRLDGFKSTRTGWKEFQFKPEMEKLDSIQKDLTGKEFQKNADKTLYVIHTPPNNTNLDITSFTSISKGQHVGSMAVRLFIEKHQPYLTLHGHIHETVDISGSFKEHIGDTLCLSAGNHNIGDKLSVLVFDLYRPQDVKRILL